MGQIKDVVIEFCDLSGDFDVAMDLLEAHDACMIADFDRFLHVRRIISKIRLAQTTEQRLRWATKLWNAIDCMDRPETHWNLMLQELPDVFYMRSVNCMKFTY